MNDADMETRVTGDRQRPAPLHGVGLEPGRVVGRYELLQRLGHGGMATVFLGRATGTAGFAKRVAIKVIHPHLATELEFVEMFLDEARLAAELHHPNVVDTLDLGQDGDNYYTVLELIEGDSLAGLLEVLDGAPLPLEVVLTILIDACAGLQAAHELRGPDGARRDLVHRDVSPQNLLVNLDGWVKVTDFGIAKAAGRTTHTRPGQLRGKLQYMSPEQARGEPIDRRADLFALGLIGYEMLSGKRPFTGDTAATSLRRVLACEIPSLQPDALHYEGARISATLAAQLCAVFERALAPDVEARFPSASDFAAALREVLAGLNLGTDDPRQALSAVMRTHFQSRVDYMHAQLRDGNERSALGMSTAVVADRDDTNSGASSSSSARGSAISGARMSNPGGGLGVGLGPVTGLTSEFPAAQTATRGGWSPRAMGLAMGVVVVTVTLGMVGWSNRGREADARASQAPRVTEASPAGEATAAPARKVRWYISSDPAGATVTIDGLEQASRTPTTVTLPRSDVPVRVVIAKEGFVSARSELAPVADQSFPYQLRAVSPPATQLSMPMPEPGKKRPRPAVSKRGDRDQDAAAETTAPRDQPAPAGGKTPAPQNRQFKPMPEFSP